MTNREKLIELLTEENDGTVNIEEMFLLLEKSPFGYSCLNYIWCEDADNSCSVCAAKWLNEEAEE